MSETSFGVYVELHCDNISSGKEFVVRTGVLNTRATIYPSTGLSVISSHQTLKQAFEKALDLMAETPPPRQIHYADGFLARFKEEIAKLEMAHNMTRTKGLISLAG
jgi:hypothetical protein